MQHPRGIVAMAAHPRLPLVAMASRRSIALWDCVRHERLCGLDVGAGTDITTLCFGHRNNWLAVGTASGNIMMLTADTLDHRYDLKQVKKVRRLFHSASLLGSVTMPHRCRAHGLLKRWVCAVHSHDGKRCSVTVPCRSHRQPCHTAVLVAACEAALLVCRLVQGSISPCCHLFRRGPSGQDTAAVHRCRLLWCWLPYAYMLTCSRRSGLGVQRLITPFLSSISTFVIFSLSCARIEERSCVARQASRRWHSHLRRLSLTMTGWSSLHCCVCHFTKPVLHAIT